MYSDLPTIKYGELNTIVNFKSPQVVGLSFIQSVGLVFGQDEMLIEVANGCKYTPPVDVVEILESEYEKLKVKIEKTKTK